MKKYLIIMITVLMIGRTGYLETHWSFNLNYRHSRPHVHYVSPRPTYYPMCYVERPLACIPCWQQPTGYYVDHRTPELACIQDGFNLICNAMSQSSPSRHNHHCRCKR